MIVKLIFNISLMSTVVLITTSINLLHLADDKVVLGFAMNAGYMTSHTLTNIFSNEEKLIVPGEPLVTSVLKSQPISTTT